MMKSYNVTVNGVPYSVQVEETTGNAAAAPMPAAAPAAPAGGTKVTAPMPGNILDVKVAVGDKVQEGQLVVLLEAMKMENEIFSPAAGSVTAVMVKKGDTVNSNDVLVTIG